LLFGAPSDRAVWKSSPTPRARSASIVVEKPLTLDQPADRSL
jgi:hypothetical protein